MLIKENKRIKWLVHSNSNRNNNSLSLHFSFGLSITLWTGSRSTKLARTGKVNGGFIGRSSRRANYYHARFESSGFGNVRDDALTVRLLPMPKTYQVFYLVGLNKIVFTHRNRKLNKQVQETQKQYAYLSSYLYTKWQSHRHLRWQDGKLLSKHQRQQNKQKTKMTTKNKQNKTKTAPKRAEGAGVDLKKNPKRMV